jgi:H-type lectin domain-containing protein
MIQSGVLDYGPKTDGWTLGSGSGVRTYVSPDIKFNPAFTAPPRIALALSGLDTEHTTNVRVTLEPADVEADEFNIAVRTWGDSLIYSVLVTWLAFD